MTASRPGGRTVLALDLGGTQVRAAVVDEHGVVHAAHRRRTPVELGRDAIVSACAEALEATRTEHAAAGGTSTPVAIGICAPGPVDPQAGEILDPPNLGPTFKWTPLAAELSRALGLPAFLDRDTQVAALAERAFGAATGCRDFLYITVSTGVGGAVVTDGRLLRGPDGTAGELGHLLIDRSGPTCGCGGVGHLEAIASGSAIARAARLSVERVPSPLLAELITTRGSAFGARDVARAEAQGDPAAAGIMARAREAFALACASLVNVFNPELIVVGGGLAIGQGEALLAPAREAIARQSFSRPAARVRIVPARLGDDVGLVGAMVLVGERLGWDGDPASSAGGAP